jgi:hypothetical protein
VNNLRNSEMRQITRGQRRWTVLSALLVVLVQSFIPTAVKGQAGGAEKCEGINCESEEAKACGSGGEGRHPTAEKQVRDDGRDKAINLVEKGLKDALAQLKDEAAKDQATPSPGKYLKLALDAINEQISKLEEKLKYWEQFRSAYCMPKVASGSILTYGNAKAAHLEYTAECNVMCTEMAKWFAKTSGTKDQAGFERSFIESCEARC